MAGFPGPHSVDVSGLMELIDGAAQDSAAPSEGRGFAPSVLKSRKCINADACFTRPVSLPPHFSLSQPEHVPDGCWGVVAVCAAGLAFAVRTPRTCWLSTRTTTPGMAFRHHAPERFCVMPMTSRAQPASSDAFLDSCPGSATPSLPCACGPCFSRLVWQLLQPGLRVSTAGTEDLVLAAHLHGLRHNRRALNLGAGGAAGVPYCG